MRKFRKITILIIVILTSVTSNYADSTPVQLIPNSETVIIEKFDVSINCDEPPVGETR